MSYALETTLIYIKSVLLLLFRFLVHAAYESARDIIMMGICMHRQRLIRRGNENPLTKGYQSESRAAVNLTSIKCDLTVCGHLMEQPSLGWMVGLSYTIWPHVHCTRLYTGRLTLCDHLMGQPGLGWRIGLSY